MSTKTEKTTKNNLADNARDRNMSRRNMLWQQTKQTNRL